MVTWNSSFEASPAGPDSAGEGDNKMVEMKQEIRALRDELDWGDSTVPDGTGYGDTRRLLPGAGRAYHIDGTTLTALPTTPLRPDKTAQLRSLDAGDDGRLAIIGGYPSFWFDGVDGSPQWKGVDITNMYAETVVSTSTSVAGTVSATPTYLLEAITPTDLEIDVTPPESGFWEIIVSASIPWSGTGAGGPGRGVAFGVEFNVEPAGAATISTVWDGNGFVGSETIVERARLDVRKVVADADRNKIHRVKIPMIKSSGSFTVGQAVVSDVTLNAIVRVRIVPYGTP